MRTPWIWSVSLGRWWNVQVGLHVFFVLFVALAFYLSGHSSFHPAIRIGFPLVLFVSILFHEIAHVTVARRLGGVADDIVIGPLGGLSSARVPYEPQSELVMLMAGVLVNAALCLVCGCILLVADPNLSLQRIFNPLAIGDISERSASLDGVRLVFWVNWCLVLVNLIPAFPFDGGRIVQALLTLMWPESNMRQTRLTICRLSQIISIVLLVLAWLTMTQQTSEGVGPGEELPLDPHVGWFSLVLLSIFVFFNARRERLQQTEIEQDEDTVFGYDFSQGYTSLERGLEDCDEEEEEDEGVHRPAPLGLFSRWLENRREAQRQRLIEQERDDEQRVDEILSRLHQYGMRSLSHEDRSLLERVSKRYRSRQS